MAGREGGTGRCQHLRAATPPACQQLRGSKSQRTDCRTRSADTRCAQQLSGHTKRQHTARLQCRPSEQAAHSQADVCEVGVSRSHLLRGVAALAALEAAAAHADKVPPCLKGSFGIPHAWWFPLLVLRRRRCQSYVIPWIKHGGGLARAPTAFAQGHGPCGSYGGLATLRNGCELCATQLSARQLAAEAHAAQPPDTDAGPPADADLHALGAPADWVNAGPLLPVRASLSLLRCFLHRRTVSLHMHQETPTHSACIDM